MDANSNRIQVYSKLIVVPGIPTAIQFHVGRFGQSIAWSSCFLGLQIQNFPALGGGTPRARLSPPGRFAPSLKVRSLGFSNPQKKTTCSYGPESLWKQHSCWMGVLSYKCKGSFTNINISYKRTNHTLFKNPPPIIVHEENCWFVFALFWSDGMGARIWINIFRNRKAYAGFWPPPPSVRFVRLWK